MTAQGALLRRAVGVLLVALLAPVSARAQSGLEEIERLTRMGRTEEARDVLLLWWDADRGGASRREMQRALWLRGRLTVDPVQAALDFRRLAVLYPSGQFTADAIFRLAQSSWAMGDEQGARDFVGQLVRDYPRSGARREAEAWLADAGPVPPPGDIPTGRADPSESAQRADAGRTDAPTDPPSSRERDEREGVAAEDDEDAAVRAMNYYVQLGAFAEEERALTLADEVRGEGVDVRVVRVDGSRFTHVRVGRFAERAAAVDVLEELTGRGINAALVRDDRPERPIGER